MNARDSGDAAGSGEPENCGAVCRAALRRIASGVGVLSVRTGVTMHGTTVSSLTAVSRDPLLVGLCLVHDSVGLGLLKRRRDFAINILNTAQAATARWFADPSRPRGPEQFDRVEWKPDLFSGAPLIDGALAWLSCRLVATVDAGDHELLLAEVVDGAAREGEPLLNFGGRLHQVELADSVPRRLADASRRSVSGSAL
ncbi:flavin reductase [Microbispora sp. RL4-1S]|uniref:Flavin reductase n=1 Tax=Microbispora oryzae TaxID=2806554 RepID=A0A941AJW9_9ACTN|nr:flavin reductase family protein [Microbispora oryzae]MBP2706825.1 flavin reductase [Microbispora oryzae]